MKQQKTKFTLIGSRLMSSNNLGAVSPSMVYDQQGSREHKLLLLMIAIQRAYSD